MLTTLPVHEFEVMVPIFAVSADVFSHKISSVEKSQAKLYAAGRKGGGSQSETARLKKNTFVTMNCNISWFFDHGNVFFVIQQSDLMKLRYDKNIFYRIVYPQLRPPHKNKDFDGFSLFLEKLETFFEQIFKNW